MAKIIKKSLILFLVISLVFSATPLMQISASAVSFDDINLESVFLKQETAVTCTLASAAMMLRRTAMISGYSDWAEITEPNLRDTAWVKGVGLRWDFSFYGMTVGHGYYPKTMDKKMFMLDLLERYPQGLVVYNTGNDDQNHAIFLTDYNEDEDMFYVSDPASTAGVGRIPITESTIVGDTQADKIDNLSAYWYVSTPEISFENGEFTSSGTVSNPYDPTHDSYNFEQTKKDIEKYYVVNYDSSKGVAVRYYPSGSSSVAKYVTKGTILYVTSMGKNFFGADWYKLNTGHYIFNTNLIPFDEYSDEIIKFNNTCTSDSGTYKISSRNGSASLRIEPSEGNNVVSEVKNDTLLYITHSGFNSVGAKWFRTQEGYYIKASEMTFVSAEKQDNSSFTEKLNLVSGEYKSTPLEDGEETPVTGSKGKYKITASALNLRSEPVDGEIFVSIPKDTVVEVSEIDNGWGKTTYDNYEGWILLDYAEKVDEQKIFKIDSVKLSSNLAQTGSTVTCTVNISGCKNALYLFSVFNDSGEKVHSTSVYMTKNSFDFTTETPGSYYFFVETKNADGQKLSTFSGNFVFHDKLQIESVKSDVDEYTYVLQEITWTTESVSASADSVYIYSLYCDDELVLEKESHLNEFVYVPEKEGKYVLYATLTDKHSESETVMADTVLVCGVLKIDEIKIPAHSVMLGSTVSYNAVPSGGTGNYQYCYTIFNEGMIVKSGFFTSENTESFTFENEGVYKIFCTVMDSGNMIASAFSKEITVISGILGDVNRDGNVAANDARIVLRHSSKVELMDDGVISLADVNFDEKITASDARLILRCAAKLENFNI